MASIASKAASAAGKAAAAAGGKGGDKALRQGPRRDPELYVRFTLKDSNSLQLLIYLTQILGGIMSLAFGMAGYYFGRSPTSATSQAEVSVANSSMPWQVDHDHENPDKHFKYQYHPKGDKSQTPKNAPSALNTVIVPNVTLPKVSK